MLTEELSKAAAAAFMPLPAELSREAEPVLAFPQVTWSMESCSADEDGTCLMDPLCEPLPVGNIP